MCIERMAIIIALWEINNFDFGSMYIKEVCIAETRTIYLELFMINCKWQACNKKLFQACKIFAKESAYLRIDESIRIND